MQAPSNELQDARVLVAGDLAAVDRCLVEQLSSDVALLQTIGTYVIASGGKRIRPLLVLLCAKACGYQQGDAHITLAAVIEMIHTATLLHDDVVDAADVRRGQATANAHWSNPAAVLTGDFLYARAFQLMVRVQSLPILELLASVTSTVVEGELLQLMHRHDPTVDETYYRKVIHYKTGALFEAATGMGGLLMQVSEPIQLALITYGHELGMAFQMVDDMLDYLADAEVLGKTLGSDWSEGKLTLPLLRALTQLPSEKSQWLSDAIKGMHAVDWMAVKQLIESTDAIDYTRTAAKVHAQAAATAIQILPSSAYRDALLALTHFVTERTA